LHHLAICWFLLSGLNTEGYHKKTMAALGPLSTDSFS
jgi:hypothetical protein